MLFQQVLMLFQYGHHFNSTLFTSKFKIKFVLIQHEIHVIFTFYTVDFKGLKHNFYMIIP